MVEVDVHDDLAEAVHIDIHDTECDVFIEYDWKPQLCRKCNGFNHSESNCTTQIPKKKPITECIVKQKGKLVKSTSMMHIPLEEKTTANSEGNTGKDVDSILVRVNAPLTEGTPIESIANTERALIPYRVENGLGNKSEDVENTVGDVIVVATPLVTLPVSPIPLGMPGFISDSPVASTGDKIVPVERSPTPTLTKSQRKSDIPFSNGIYTWCKNRQITKRIHSKLDRGLMNEAWSNSFPTSRIDLTSSLPSDHWGLCVRIPINVAAGPKPFQFLRVWHSQPVLKQVIKEAWSTRVNGDPIVKVVQKLRVVKKAVRVWNTTKFGSVYEHLISAKTKLEECQVALSNDPMYAERIHSEEEARRNYEHALSNEEILDDNGIKNLLLQHYTSLFSSRGHVNSPDATFIRRTLLGEVADSLEANISRDEIKASIHSMGLDTALGPDGFTVRFFREYWGIIGEDINSTVLHFFQCSVMDKGLNSTFITLIPKMKVANKIGDFRPIALCNVIYKIITKLLDNRLSVVLDQIVGKDQNAFVSGRKIQDNLIIASELLRGFGAKHAPPTLAWKVDLRKAYDSVQWEFPFSLLQLYGFRNKWIGWVKAAVTTVQFSIMVNGSPHGFFQPSRGLRQGCPLSPLLFTLVIEYLSSMFEFECLKEHLVASPTAIKAGVFPFTSLGLPISDRGIRRLDCKPLIDKVVAATIRWASMNLSMAGRIELLRAVVTPMLLYWSLVYSIHAAVINLIERRMRNFAWGHNEINLKLHSICWKKSLLQKQKEKSIVSVRDTLKVQCSYRIGNGAKIKNFMDPWCGGQFLSEVFSYRTFRQVSSNKLIDLKSFIVQNQWQFDDVPFVVQQFFQQFRIHGGEDQLLWNNKSFKFKAAWDSCRDSKPEASWFGLVWNGGRPRWSVYSALIIQNAVLICANLQHRGISLASRCGLCGCNEEHVDHMFVKYPLSEHPYDSSEDTLSQKPGSSHGWNKVHKMLFTTAMYYLWNERNGRLHSDVIRSPLFLVKYIIWDALDIAGISLQEFLSL
ncbi:uncharacterized protein LOC132266309 [Cornus florida]|uniref:uncharacterized protein LOC132266309 n=1 Tax=Cornus florida TaxID=4283 RepID=UPI0028A155A2|nr:uncharacterized protein LOC132266309 [Cornus florida]